MTQAGDPEGSLLLTNLILEGNPHDAIAAIVAGDALLKEGKKGLAFHYFRTASQLEPEWADAWCNMGLCLVESRNLDQARACLMRAFEIDDKHQQTMVNLAALEYFSGNHERCIAWADKALELGPAPEAEQNAALSMIALEQWDRAWGFYRAGIGEKMRPERFYGDDVGRWDGKPTEGLVVYTEQGLGDEIMFGSMLPDVIRDNRGVVLECTPKMEGLFRRSFPDVTVYGTRPTSVAGDVAPEWRFREHLTAKIEIGGLGEFYRRKKADFPRKPFLIPDDERRIQWRALLDSLGDKPKIGIAWHGGVKQTRADQRSLDLEDLLPILGYDAEWVSLEYRPLPVEMEDFEKKHGIKIHHWPHAVETNDYDDTAALVAELDLVVTVTTAVANLCGAIGKECWVLVPENAPYRYVPDESPWYSGQKNYRQDGDWPISQVLTDLHKWRAAPLAKPRLVKSAIYDVSKAPASFDFLSWLVRAKMEGCTGVRLVTDGFRKDKLPKSPEYRQWMVDNVMRPAISMLGMKETDYGTEEYPYTLKPVIDLARQGHEVPKFQASKQARDFVAKFTDDRPLIVVTTREAEHWTERNSNMEAWAKLVGLWMDDKRVVFIRDTEAVFGDFKGETAPWASVNLDLRMALYEAADLNLAVNNGPCHLLYFSDAPYVVFKQLVGVVPGCTEDWWSKAIGLKVGEQYPWARSDQVLAWKPDTYENIKEAVDQCRLAPMQN